MNKNLFLTSLALIVLISSVSCSKTTDDLKVNSDVVDQKEDVQVDIVQEENTDPGQLYQKGLVYLRNNNIEQAEKNLLLAISRDPKYFMGYNLLAQYYVGNKHFKTSMDYYNKALEVYPQCHIAYAGIGEIYFMQKNTDKAIENLEKAIELKPDFKMVYPALSKMYAVSGNKKAAIETLKKYKSLFPEESEQIALLVKEYSK